MIVNGMPFVDPVTDFRVDRVADLECRVSCIVVRDPIREHEVLLGEARRNQVIGRNRVRDRSAPPGRSPASQSRT
jgi:hypothetical protein